MIRKLLGSVVVVTLAVCASPASGQGNSFGPVESRTFHWKPGTVIETVPASCASNIDWLLVRAPGIANAKSVEVTPKVSQVADKHAFPASNCTGPDCLPVFIKITAKDAPGPRTFTAKHADGRTISTTFDVNPNS
jgi:hypothetical protein